VAGKADGIPKAQPQPLLTTNRRLYPRCPSAPGRQIRLNLNDPCAKGQFTRAAGPQAEGSNLCRRTGRYAFLKLHRRTTDTFWLESRKRIRRHDHRPIGKARDFGRG
jgi:hypothetical protein